MRRKICTTIASDQNGEALSGLSCGSPTATPSCSSAWYAVQTRRRCEKKVDALLARKGIETFLPLVRQLRRWPDRNQPASLPLFPGYLFARLHLDPSSRLRVLQTTSVVAFVGIQDVPTPIPASLVDDLRRLLLSDAECSIRPFLQTGQRVRIRGGSLDGLQGILQHGGKHLVISIDCIQRSVSFQVEGYDLEVA